MNEFYLIVGMMGVTFSIRYAVLGLGGRLHLSQKLTNLLGYVPPAVLTAIIVPAVLMPTDEQSLTLINARSISAIVAIMVSYSTKNLLLTIGLGMTTFLILKTVC
jgi:branched-subunit amino acid transport protein